MKLFGYIQQNSCKRNTDGSRRKDSELPLKDIPLIWSWNDSAKKSIPFSDLGHSSVKMRKTRRRGWWWMVSNADPAELLFV